MNDVYWSGVAATVALYAAFLIVGWIAGRKAREGTAAELLVAGRSMPLWIATLTMTATWVDGGYLLGTAEAALKSLALSIQGGLCFGLSLILGGVFFAKKMRRLEYTTIVDPFEARYGRHWAAVLMAPAVLGEIIWSAELLVAIGSTFGAILNIDLTSSIWFSAGVVTLYTLVGGMWSVAYTDVVQLGLIPLGMIVAIPFALAHVGGFHECLAAYSSSKLEAARLIPPLRPTQDYWTGPAIVHWWETTFMLVLGGIPWNCYFQRVLSCQSPTKARWHSIIAGALTILLVLPPLLLGMVAAVYRWPPSTAATLATEPAMALPLLLRDLTPYFVGLLGLAAIVGAVTSSFSSSILSAGSMLSWNVYRRLLAPQASVAGMKLVIRGSIGALGVLAALLALRVESVQQLWFFTADLVFVLLFPQLVMALFDPKANLVGSVVAFAVSLLLRLGGGEEVLGIPAFLPYPELFAGAFKLDPADWYDPHSGASTFPYKMTAMVAGLALLPLVSRLTARWHAPRRLEQTEP